LTKYFNVTSVHRTLPKKVLLITRLDSRFGIFNELMPPLVNVHRFYYMHLMAPSFRVTSQAWIQDQTRQPETPFVRPWSGGLATGVESCDAPSMPLLCTTLPTTRSEILTSAFRCLSKKPNRKSS
jgi:hypothetical protein